MLPVYFVFKPEQILGMDCEELMTFFQQHLEQDSSFEDDKIIDSLVRCMSDLRNAKMDLPDPPVDASEHPNRPFGLFVPTSVERMIGRRTLETETELICGRRTTLRHEHRLSISIPPDGGPEGVESFDPLDMIKGSNRVSAYSSHAGRTRYPKNALDPVTFAIHEKQANGFIRSGNAQKSNNSAKALKGGKLDRRLSDEQKTHVGGGQQFILSDAVDSAAPQQYGATVRL